MGDLRRSRARGRALALPYVQQGADSDAREDPADCRNTCDQPLDIFCAPEGYKGSE